MQDYTAAGNEGMVEIGQATTLDNLGRVRRMSADYIAYKSPIDCTVQGRSPSFNGTLQSYTPPCAAPPSPSPSCTSTTCTAACCPSNRNFQPCAVTNVSTQFDKIMGATRTWPALWAARAQGPRHGPERGG